MVREISAGGVVARHTAAGWQVAVIEPQNEAAIPAKTKMSSKKSQKMLLALPKGLVDPGEKPEETAVREVREETGLAASIIVKLGDIKYVYVRTWAGGERVFKIVSFYLLRYVSGEIDDVVEDMRIEVKRALWIDLADAARKLSYQGERDMLNRAAAYIEAHPALAQTG
jgi:8-oxo-dGTP pyrophosphatase MutT (NUDIX family)